MSTTLADEMRLQGSPAPRVVSISLKARSAINLGGHKPDAVIWLDEADGEWVTSTAFANAPTPFFADYIVRSIRCAARWAAAGNARCRSISIVYDYSTQDRRRIALVTEGVPAYRQGHRRGSRRRVHRCVGIEPVLG